MRLNPKKSAALVKAFTAAFLFLAGCHPQQQPEKKKVVKIGLAAPLTGDVAVMGIGMRNGATIAVEEANQSGAFDFKIELVPMDDRASAKEAVNVANQLVSDPNVVAVVGHLNSHCSIAASRVYNQHRVAMVTPASTNPALTQQGFDNVFRLCTTDNVQGRKAADFVVGTLGKKRVAVVHDKTSYGQGLAEQFRKRLEELGGEALIFEGINVGDKDFRALLTKIKSLRPELIYFGGMIQEGAMLSLQSDEIGLEVPLMGGDGIFTDEYIKIGKVATDGDYATKIGPPMEKLPRASEFIQKYKKRFPNTDVQPYDPYTYDAVNIVLEAIKKVGPDREKVIQALKKVEYNGIIGLTKFDERGDTLNKAIAVMQVKDGRWVEAALHVP